VRYGVGAATGRTCTVLEAEHAELPLPEAKSCPDWLYPNAEGAGYYRSNISSEALRKLMSVADKRLTRFERVALLGDVTAMASAGTLPAAEALALAARYAEEPDRQVFSASLDLLDAVDERALTDARREDYHRFLRNTYGPRARKLGFSARPGEDEDTRLLRPRLLALAGGRGGDPALVAEAKKLARQWLKDPSSVSQEVLMPVLGMSAHYAAPEFLPKFQQALKAATERKMRQELIMAMVSVREPQLLRQVLSMVLDPANDPRELVWVLYGPSQNPETREVVYGFVKENYDALIARLPEQFSAYLPRLGVGWCDPEHRQDVVDFFAERSAKDPAGPRVLAQVKEEMDLCIGWKQAQGASVDAFLTKGPVKAPAPQ
jgi:alanyl aminopeptidase